MKDNRDYKFKFFLTIEKGYYYWHKSRGANFMEIHFLKLKIIFGMPYLHKFIYEQGYTAGIIANKNS
jgi:hypothetical protein